MKKRYKKANTKTAFIFLLIAFLMLFGTASLVANFQDLTAESDDKITANTIIITKENSLRVPNSNQEIPNDNEGTIVLWTKPPVEIFNQFSNERDYLIFFSSTNIPGLRIIYNMKEKRFEAGTPLLKSPEIDIFDGKNHQLTYTFKKNSKQLLFLDSVKVDESDFRPLKISAVTGLAISVGEIKEIDISGVEIAMYDHYIDENHLENI